MLICKSCDASKSETEFYDQPNCERGKMQVCKECHKARMRARSRTNPKVQAYDRARPNKAARLQRQTEYTKRWRAENPDAYKAHTAVGNAVRDGKLKKLPCEFCGDEKVHAHHKDYSKPLDVIWLCAKCHNRLHANFPELEGVNKTIAGPF